MCGETESKIENTRDELRIARDESAAAVSSKDRRALGMTIFPDRIAEFVRCSELRTITSSNSGDGQRPRRGKRGRGEGQRVARGVTRCDGPGGRPICRDHNDAWAVELSLFAFSSIVRRRWRNDLWETSTRNCLGTPMSHRFPRAPARQHQWFIIIFVHQVLRPKPDRVLLRGVNRCWTIETAFYEKWDYEEGLLENKSRCIETWNLHVSCLWNETFDSCKILFLWQ